MANKLIAAPTDLISRSVGQVFFQRASEKNSNQENLHNLLKKTFKNLAKIALLIFIPALIIAPFLKFILGLEWEMTGFFVMIITPAIFTKFLFVPVSSIYTILNRQKKMALFFFINLVFRVLAIYLGFIIFDNALIAIALYSVVGVVFYSFMIIIFLRITKLGGAQFETNN